MRINFNEIPETTVPGLHDGSGELTAKMFTGEFGKVIPCRIHPGGSIGLHCHETGVDVSYVLFGNGVATCDGVEELLTTDVCHICPAGSEHSIRNTGVTDLVMLTVVLSCPEAARS